MTQRSNRYAPYLRAAERMRAEAQKEMLSRAASTMTLSRATVRGLGVAFVLAAGAFVLTMLKDPPRSEASDPATVVPKVVDIQVPTDMPALTPLDCYSTTQACP